MRFLLSLALVSVVACNGDPEPKNKKNTPSDDDDDTDIVEDTGDSDSDPVEPIDLTGIDGRTTVRVVDLDGNPIEGADIELFAYLQQGSEPWKGTTDSDGLLVFDPFAADTYDPTLALPREWMRVSIDAEGYDSHVVYAEVTYPQICEADFQGPALTSCNTIEVDLIEVGAVGVDLLPDVMVDPESIKDCRIRTKGNGNRTLRVSVGTPNAGRGPADIQSVHNSQVVHQYVHQKGGGTREIELPDAAFVWAGHEDHNHFHFEDWTHIRLLTLDEQEVSIGNKVSFCLVDLSMFDRHIFEVLWGRDTDFGCGQSGNLIYQGLSPGKSDIYDWSLEGQEIPITGLPGGQYWLTVEVDPEQHIHELSDDNNLARVLVTLPDPDDDVSNNYNPCRPGFLQNQPDIERTSITLSNTCATATALTPGNYEAAPDGISDSGGVANGRDAWFTVDLQAGETLQAEGRWTGGNTHIGIYESCDTKELVHNNDVTWGASEVASHTATADQTVIVVIDSKNGTGAVEVDVTY